MKPAPFEYLRPDSLAETCAILAADEDARIIAGGQTLIPMLAMRLARPTKLVDILRLKELRGIRFEDDAIVIGAVTRQVEVERNELVHRKLPLLMKALPWVGHPPTRNRGTVGGSIANADPSAEIPLIAVTLSAEIEIANPSDRTRMPADEFFIGPMLTSVMPGDCVCAVRFPVWSHPQVGTGFHEVSARQSDFAFVAAAAQVALDESGRCLDAALGLGGVGDRAIRIDVSPLIGENIAHVSISDIVRAATADLETSSDLHASAAYRQRVAAVLGTRALEDAIADARAGGAQSAEAVIQ
ncbi:FAD binding domain-containing protein [Bradyrhizobium canariense]|uniref:Carbon-monoxide dehydrogenase medium subunit n=1 Tax=Bradyrhizobium canariense TaxID=255045 RepID=A0A1H1UG70_9BRAD|nr:FAD binding domain-containing protein [Bradyrhizobium canariense]SDS71370.1 carbon-monoxide dehydrogenase medium subunit [Bradyrhizobium canariense]